MKREGSLTNPLGRIVSAVTTQGEQEALIPGGQNEGHAIAEATEEKLVANSDHLASQASLPPPRELSGSLHMLPPVITFDAGNEGRI